jgi:cysteinyl-tRNA synthetase
MTLKLYDTMAREKRPFVPADPDRVTMYVCGPTVYDYAHIGNARPVVVFDVLFRLLRGSTASEARDLCPQRHRRGRQDQRKAADEGVAIRVITDRYSRPTTDMGALGALPRRCSRASPTTSTPSRPDRRAHRRGCTPTPPRATCCSTPRASPTTASCRAGRWTT